MSNKSSKNLDQDYDEFEQFLEGLDESENESTLPPDTLVESEDAPQLIFFGPSGGAITFVRPGEPQSVSPEYVMTTASEIRNFLASEAIIFDKLQQYRVLVAFPGNLLAYEKVEFSTDKTSEPLASGTSQQSSKNVFYLEPGPHMVLNERGEFSAEQYGFVHLQENKLTLCPPIRISNDLLSVEWLVPARHPGGVSREMLDFWLKDNGVSVETVANLDDLINRVNNGCPETQIYTIASGQAPVPGVDGRIEWQVKIGRTFGKKLRDGRFDFRERNYVVNVKKNQLVANLQPAVDGIPGSDVKGRLLDVVDGKPMQLIPGKNITKKQAGLDVHYVANIDGGLHYHGNKVSVARLMILPEGVNYQTGNINFIGDVLVQGSVISGFSIIAEGDVTVTDNVESGSIITAQGDIVVGKSIFGKQTNVTAGGDLRAQSVHEATVAAGKDIVLGGYAFHARLRAGGHIQVENGGEKHVGCIMGGEAWATAGIDMYIAGTSAWGHTELLVGISPEQLEKLEGLQKSIESKNTNVRNILDYFGLTSIDLNAIRVKIEEAEGIQKKTMALRAKHLAIVGKYLQQLLAEREHAMEQVGPVPDNVEIKIREKAFPNVAIKIGGKKQKLKLEFGPVRFHLDKQGNIVT